MKVHTSAPYYGVVYFLSHCTYFLQIRFQIWTASWLIRCLQLNIYDENLDVVRSIECKQMSTGKAWEVTVTDLPASSKFVYSYNYDIEQENGSYVQIAGKMRTLGPQNMTICDTLSCDECKLSCDDMFEGLTYNLQSLFDTFLECHSTISSLNDLEHMWKFSAEVFNREKATYLQNWAEKYLNIYSQGENTKSLLLFPAVVYGIVCPYIGNEVEIKSLKKYQLQKVLDTIANLTEQDVTNWSIPCLRETGLAVLRSLKELNWLTVVAYLGNLYYTPKFLLEVYEEGIFNKHKIPVARITAFVIPQLHANYGEDQTLLEEFVKRLPSSWGFDDNDRVKLSQTVQDLFHGVTAPELAAEAKEAMHEGLQGQASSKVRYFKHVKTDF